ncbi:MAG: hypothetical protein WCG87_10390 [Bacteroidota bacterium]
MGSLSRSFKISNKFQNEFEILFPNKPFTKEYILQYITACTNHVFKQAAKKFPDHKLKYINPIFVIDKMIYPASNLAGDHNINRSVLAAFHLVATNEIIPISQPIRQNKLKGICLFSGSDLLSHTYNTFKTFNLDLIVSNEDIIADDIDEKYLVEKVSRMDIDLENLNQNFHAFSRELQINATEDIVKLKKTLVLYQLLAKALNGTTSISFVNSTQQNSFFHCLLTLISEQPFKESELLDFATVLELMSQPLENYKNAIHAASKVKRHL